MECGSTPEGLTGDCRVSYIAGYAVQYSIFNYPLSIIHYLSTSIATPATAITAPMIPFAGIFSL